MAWKPKIIGFRTRNRPFEILANDEIVFSLSLSLVQSFVRLPQSHVDRIILLVVN
jgi:hypothetical protein